MASQMQSLGLQTMDQNLVACRKALNRKIYNFIQRNVTSDELLRKAPEMARHLEERVFNYVASRDDYINLVMDPAERLLQSILMHYFTQKQPPQHVAASSVYSTMIPTPGISCNGSIVADISGSMENRAVTTSSTEVLSQTATKREKMQPCANGLTDVGNSTSFNNQDGLISNSYRHQTANYAGSSSGGGIASSIATGNIPRQLPQMIPTPGFSNPQSLPASSEFAAGANFSSTDSTMNLKAAQEKKYAGVQSNNMVHGLGGQIAPGIQSNNMAQKSSHGLSNGLANNGLDLSGSNMASSRLLGNSSYGGSLMSMQQHFDQQHQQSRILTSLPQQVIMGDNYPVKSSHMRPQILDRQQEMIFQSTETMNDCLLQPQKQLQRPQQQPNQTYSQFAQNKHQLERPHSLQNQQLMSENDATMQAPMSSNFGDQIRGNAMLKHPESHTSQTQQIQLSEFQSHYHQNTSFVDNAKIAQVLDHLSGSQDFHVPVSHGSSGALQQSRQQVDMFNNNVFSNQPQTESLLQDKLSTQPCADMQILERNSRGQQFLEVLHQRIEGYDEAHQLCVSGEEFNSPAAIIPQVSKVSAEPERSAQELDYRKQIRWLLLLWHARTCPAPKGQCQEAKCAVAHKCLMHVNNCENDLCIDHNCVKTKKLLKHYKSCKVVQCPVCGPVHDHLTKNHTVQSLSLPESALSSQTKVDPDRMSIDTVPEAFDHMQSLPKRMKIEDPSLTVVTSCETSPVSVSPMKETDICNEVKPYACDGIMSISARFGVTSNMIHPSTEHKKENFANSGSDTAGASSAARSHIDSVVPVKQENVLDENDKDHDSTPVKREVTDPSADQTTAGKSGKPKIKGVSLTELFTPEQIREHITGLRQWVGQTKAKAEKNQAMERIMSENSCQLCAVEKLTFEPPPIYCSLCGGRIKRNAMYYTIGSGDTRNFFCIPCYNDVRSDSIEVDGSIYPKAKMEKKKNDEDTEEWWVQCDKCEAWQHQVCALFNGRRNDGGQAEYTCPNCCIEEIEKGERKPLPQNTVLGAKDLPRTILSDHIEQRLFRRLRHERIERAKHLGKSYDEVPGAEGLVVRVVSSVDKKLEVKPRFLEIFQEENYPKEFPYKSKAVLLFQKIEGVEVCLFGMYVQEFGSECAFPNQRRVYLSYLDSVKYFRPEIKTFYGEALRTFVYHEILIGYLEYCKKRGFTSCYIWACPPLKGEDYILYCHPEIQKTPKSDKLREWYLSMLRKASKENIVVELTNLYDHFFVTMGECKAKPTAARLPYFDGDYWPGAAEDMINQLRQEEDGTNKQKKGKTKKIITKRALKAAGQTDLSGNASKDAMLMQKLGETICPMKEDFIMVHLQHCCNHCCILMVSGTRWVCHLCKNFQLCDKCYEVERRIEERERHPVHSREKHAFYPVEINDVQADTKDKDEILESEFFDTRQAFLSLCQGNHYQYDTLRRAKHSSMMVLYHLHNPTAPAFVITCYVCHNDIETGQGWCCETCADFDVCNACYLKGGINHPHKLTNHPSIADRDAQNKEARQQRVLQLRKMMDLLVHASQCRFPHCQYPNCRKVKGLFRHGIQCKIRASRGCVVCKKMWYLLQNHAQACKESECIVPRCRDLKEHLRRLQQQAESRRRAAVMEMMRQRAAEVTGNN